MQIKKNFIENEISKPAFSKFSFASLSFGERVVMSIYAIIFAAVRSTYFWKKIKNLRIKITSPSLCNTEGQGSKFLDFWKLNLASSSKPRACFGWSHRVILKKFFNHFRNFFFTWQFPSNKNQLHHKLIEFVWSVFFKFNFFLLWNIL